MLFVLLILCCPLVPFVRRPCVAVQDFDYALVRRMGNTEQVIAQVGKSDLRDSDAVTVEVSMVNAKWYLRVSGGLCRVQPCAPCHLVSHGQHTVVAAGGLRVKPCAPCHLVSHGQHTVVAAGGLRVKPCAPCHLVSHGQHTVVAAGGLRVKPCAPCHLVSHGQHTVVAAGGLRVKPCARWRCVWGRACDLCGCARLVSLACKLYFGGGMWVRARAFCASAA